MPKHMELSRPPVEPAQWLRGPARMAALVDIARFGCPWSTGWIFPARKRAIGHSRCGPVQLGGLVPEALQLQGCTLHGMLASHSRWCSALSWASRSDGRTWGPGFGLGRQPSDSPRHGLRCLGTSTRGPQDQRRKRRQRIGRDAMGAENHGIGQRQLLDDGHGPREVGGSVCSRDRGRW